VINDYLGRYQEILAVLGAIEDQEDNVSRKRKVLGVIMPSRDAHDFLIVVLDKLGI
jgi:hypothetical protein